MNCDYENIKPCEPNEIIRCRDGWISPEGEIFKCTSHEIMAKCLVEKFYGTTEFDESDFFEYEHSDYLETKGWVRVTTTAFWNLRMKEGYWKNRKLTQSQINMLWDWCDATTMDYPPIGDIEIV